MERPSSSDTHHIARLATKGSVQQSLVNRPVYSEHVPVTQGPGTRCSVSPTTPGRPGAPTTPGSSGWFSSHRLTNQCTLIIYRSHLDPVNPVNDRYRSELPVLNSPVRLVQLEHNVHESLGNMPTLQIEHSSEHSQAFQDLTNSDSPVPCNIGCTGYTRSDQVQPVTLGALVTPGDPSLGTLFQIDPLGLGPIPPDPTLGIWLVSLISGFRHFGFAFWSKPPLGGPAFGHAMQYSSLRSGSKRPVDRPSSSKYQTAWSATKAQFSSHWSTDQYTVNIHTGTGTRYPVTSGHTGYTRSDWTSLSYLFLIHRSHRSN